MAELSHVAGALGLDEADARHAIEAAEGGSRTPAHVQVLLGMGAWIAAILILAFVLLFLDFILGIDLERQASVAVGVGVACYAIAVLLRVAARASAFVTQLASALSTAGIAIAAGAVLVKSDSFWAGAAVAALGAAVAVLEGRDHATQFASAALAIALAVAAFDVDRVPYVVDLAALGGLAGVALTLCPPRRDVGPLAAVLLLTLPAMMVTMDYGVLAAGEDGEGWAARAIAAATAIGLLVLHRRLAGRRGVDATLLAFAVGIAAVSALLPPGGSAALMLMMLAFVAGARGLGAIAILFQIYFVGRFYYDLQVTLLDKSLILAAVGAVALALYALLLWRRGQAAS